MKVYMYEFESFVGVSLYDNVLLVLIYMIKISSNLYDCVQSNTLYVCK